MEKHSAFAARPIRSKLLAGFGVLLLLVVLTAGAGLAGLQAVGAGYRRAIERGLQIRRGALRAEVQLLQARRREKDFLLRWDGMGVNEARERYVEANKQALEDLRATISELRELVEATRDRAGEVLPDRQGALDSLDTLNSQAAKYASGFEELVSLIERRGARDTGMVGRFRTAVHGVEAAFGSDPSLSAALLQLRRREKDYLLRGDQAYVQEVIEGVAALEAAVVGRPGAEQAPKLLESYLAGFKEVVTLDKQIAEHANAFRKAAHRIEKAAVGFVKVGQRLGGKEVANAQAEAERTFNLVASTVVLILVLGLVLSWVLARSLTRPIGELVSAAREVGGGDFERRAEVLSGDEIGELARAFNTMTDNLVQHMRDLAAEKATSERLLLNILPRPIATRLKQDEQTIADGAEATVLFADVVGFTVLASRLTPTELVARLNEIFTTFDELTAVHGIEKIKTIGDCYMAVGGIPEVTEDHAQRVADFGLDMLAALERMNEGQVDKINLRVGINTGPVVAGVIGSRKFIYDLWGDAVNLASRMESHGVVGSIQVSESTAEHLGDGYDLEDRGEIEVKGKGKMRTFLLHGRRAV